jgi:preprotein translocase subunit SecY
MFYLSESIYKLISRIAFNLLAIFIYRLGAALTIPGINPKLIDTNILSDKENLLSILNRYSGGEFEGSIFVLGVGPYITASIICQMIFSIFPILIQKKKENPSIVAEWNRYLMIPIAFAQGLYTITELYRIDRLSPDFNVIGNISLLEFYFLGTLSIVTGMCFLVFLGEQITTHGIGNGISVIITANIISKILSDSKILLSKTALLYNFIFIIILFTFFIVFIEISQRNIKVIFPHKISSGELESNQKAEIPLKINQNGVLPPILANNLFMGSLFVYKQLINFFPFIAKFSFSNQISDFIFAVIVFILSYTYLEISLDCEDIAKRLQSYPLTLIRGIRPGENTVTFLKEISFQLCTLGSIYIIFVDMSPQVISTVFLEGINHKLLGTSLLIVVTVIIDIISKCSTYLLPVREQLLTKKPEKK